MTSNSLIENEEQDIPLHFLKTIFGLHASVIFRPKYVWFPVHLKDPVIPDPSGQLVRLIAYITSTRVDLYSLQILLIGTFREHQCVKTLGEVEEFKLSCHNQLHSQQERRQTVKYSRLPRSVYLQKVETAKQSGPWSSLGI